MLRSLHHFLLHRLKNKGPVAQAAEDNIFQDWLERLLVYMESKTVTQYKWYRLMTIKAGQQFYN